MDIGGPTSSSAGGMSLASPSPDPNGGTRVPAQVLFSVTLSAIALTSGSSQSPRDR
jgi:hypothetical protein